jgi:hypothetical protein
MINANYKQALYFYIGWWSKSQNLLGLHHLSRQHCCLQHPSFSGLQVDSLPLLRSVRKAAGAEYLEIPAIRTAYVFLRSYINTTAKRLYYTTSNSVLEDSSLLWCYVLTTTLELQTFRTSLVPPFWCSRGSRRTLTIYQDICDNIPKDLNLNKLRCHDHNFTYAMNLGTTFD